MAQRREHVRLWLEQNHALGIVRKRFMQDFDCNATVELIIVARYISPMAPASMDARSHRS
jgi:hypothetical protein